MLYKRATRDRGLGMMWVDRATIFARQQSEEEWRVPVYPGRSMVDDDGFDSPQDPTYWPPTPLQRARTPTYQEERFSSTSRRRDERSRSPPSRLPPSSRSDRPQRRPSSTFEPRSTGSVNVNPPAEPALHLRLSNMTPPPPPPPPQQRFASTFFGPAELLPLHVARSFFVLKISGIPSFIQSVSGVVRELPPGLNPDGVWRDPSAEQQRNATTEMFFLFRNRDHAEEVFEYINRPFRIQRGISWWSLHAEREPSVLPLAMPHLRKEVREQIKRELGWSTSGMLNGGRGFGGRRTEERRRPPQDDLGAHSRLPPPPLRRPSLSTSISSPLDPQASVPPSPPPILSHPNPRLRNQDDDEPIFRETTPLTCPPLNDSATDSPLLHSCTPITPVANEDDEQDWPRAPALSDDTEDEEGIRA